LMIVYLVLLLAVLGGIGGGLWTVHRNGYNQGLAECQAQVKAADDQLRAEAAKREQEAANHITDMQAAYEVGESQAKTKVVTVVSKGAKDVATYPVFSNPACVLPDDSLRTLNASRSSMRNVSSTDVGLHNDSSTGASVQPAANPSSSNGAVRGAGVVDGGAAKGSVSSNATGRRPLGKMH
jgi:hypothetical protein